MRMQVKGVFVLVTCLVLAAAVSAQTPTTPTKPPNESQISIQQIVPNSAGVTVWLTASQLRLLGASLEKQNPTTGNWVSVVDSIYLPVPGDLLGTRDATAGTLTLPLVVEPDPSVLYRLSFFSKSQDDLQMDWNNAIPMTFHGYTANVAQSFKLEFTNDALKISTATPDKATLTAAWQFPGMNPVNVQESMESQNPTVSLSFAALQATAANVPSLVLTLVDKTTHQKQEARLTMTVASTQPVSQKLKDAETRPSKDKISWGDLAKTGIGALLKFFLKP